MLKSLDEKEMIKESYILGTLALTISGEWFKGHYSGSSKTVPHRLNQLADSLTSRHIKTSSASYAPSRTPLPIDEL